MHTPDETGTTGAAMGQDKRAATADETPPATMQQMIYGFAFSQMLYVAAKLGLADLLAESPKPIEALAAATGTQAPALFRVLRVLVSVGVFTQDAQQRFALTPRAAWLRTNVPGSLRSMAVYWGSPWMWHAWGQLREAVRTGQTAFDLVHGVPLFTYLEQPRRPQQSSISTWGRGETTGTPHSLPPMTSPACTSSSMSGAGTAPS